MANNPGKPKKIFHTRIMAIVIFIISCYATSAVIKGTVKPFGLPKIISNLFTSEKSEQTDANIDQEQISEEEDKEQTENKDGQETNQIEEQVQTTGEQENNNTVQEDSDENIVFEQVIIVGE